MSSPDEENPLDVDIPGVNRSSDSHVDKFCRLCLEVHPDLLPLKSRLGGLPVPKMFACLTGIEIDFNDDYPKVACSQCFFKLEQAYQTRQDFVDNYHTLLSIVIAGPETDNVVVREEIVDEDSKAVSILKEEYYSDLNDVEMVEQDDCSKSMDSPESKPCLESGHDALDKDESVPYESIKKELDEEPMKKPARRKQLRPKTNQPKKSAPISINEKRRHLRTRRKIRHD